jgi:hypothetical protein
MARNFGELVTAVIYKDFEAKANIETEIKAWINDGYMRMADRNLRCFRKKSELSITSASQKYAISTALPDYRLMIEQWTTSGPIDFNTEERAMSVLYYGDDFTEWSEGYPTASWIDSDYIYFFPRIDDSYTVYSYYYYIPSRMSDDTDTHVIPSNKEELLINYAKILYDFREKDWNAVDRQIAMFENELEKWEIADNKIGQGMTSILELQREYAGKLKTRSARIWP